jgi:hypothetical protein
MVKNISSIHMQRQKLNGKWEVGTINKTYKTNTMTTKVKFLYHEKNDDLFAYFPFDEWCNGTKSCYTPMEGHSAVHPLYTLECREATLPEYLDLFNELQSIGYRLELI